MAIQQKLQPRGASSGSVATKVFSLANVTSKGAGAPGRWGLHAQPGFSKTSMLAYSRNPIFILAKGETGLLSLIDSGQIPDTPHFPECQTWNDLITALETLLNVEHGYKTLVLDTLNGFERMLYEYVCERDFDGDWGDKGFGGYQRGFEVSLADWRIFLNLADRLRLEKGMTLFFLMHTRVKNFKNPSGADFDKYAPEMNDKTWALTKGWLTAYLCGALEVTVTAGGKDVSDNPSKRGKASDTAHRVLYTSMDNPIFDAKNTCGLPAEIALGDSAKESWEILARTITKSRKITPAPTSEKEETK